MMSVYQMLHHPRLPKTGTRVQNAARDLGVPIDTLHDSGKS